MKQDILQENGPKCCTILCSSSWLCHLSSPKDVSNENNVHIQDDTTPSPYQHLNLKHYLPDRDNKIGLTDRDLVDIPTRDLNKKLKQLPQLKRDEKEKIKKKRRTLKNRWALNGLLKFTKDNYFDTIEDMLEIAEKKRVLRKHI